MTKELNKQYELDQSIDTKIALTLPPVKNLNLSYLKNIPTDWLAQLTNESGLNKKILDHELADYPEAEDLKLQLQLIFLRIHGDFDKDLGALTPEMKGAIFAKMNASIHDDTHYFHMDLQEITQMFIKPSSLAELVYLVRYSLVSKIAQTYYSDMTDWQKMSKIAASDGLGIYPMPLEGHNPHLFCEGDYRDHLATNFSYHFNSFQLPLSLTKALKTVLAYQGYKGKKVQGYSIAQREQLTQMIQNYFSDAKQPANQTSETSGDFFIHNKKDIYTDIDWKKIEKQFFEILKNEGYLNPSKLHPRNIRELVINQKLGFTQLTAIDDIYKQLFNQLIAKLNEGDQQTLIEFIREVEFCRKRVPQEYTSYLEPLIKNEKNKIFPMISGDFINFAAENNPSGLKAVLGFIDYNKDKIEIPKLFENHNPLYHALKASSENANLIMDFIEDNLDTEQIIEMIAANHVLDENLLTFSCDYRPLFASRLLAYFNQHFKEITPRRVNAFLGDTNYWWKNSLMLLSEYRADQVSNMLNFINDHKESLTSKSIVHLLTEQSKRNIHVNKSYRAVPDKTALMLAAMNGNPKTVKAYIRFLDTNFDFLGAKNIGIIFNILSFSDITALYYIKAYCPEALPQTLTFYINHLEDLGLDTFMDLMNQTSCKELSKLPEAYQDKLITAYTNQDQIKNFWLDHFLSDYYQQKLQNASDTECQNILNKHGMLLLKHLFDKDFKEFPKERTLLIINALLNIYENYLNNKKQDDSVINEVCRFFKNHFTPTEKLTALLKVKDSIADSDKMQDLIKNYPVLKTGKLGSLYKALLQTQEKQLTLGTSLVSA